MWKNRRAIEALKVVQTKVGRKAERAYKYRRVGRRRRVGKSVGKCLKEIAAEAGKIRENARKRRTLLNVRWCGA